MNSQLKISVVMPVFNAAAYLSSAVESVLSQTLGDFELILIDDGSTDKSQEIIRSFSDPRIVLIKNEANEGLVASLNKGIASAKGKYIARMDADDICLPNRFALQVEFLDSNPNCVLCATQYTIIRNGKELNLNWWYGSAELPILMMFANAIAHPTVMIRRSSLDDLKFDPFYKHVEDYRLWTLLIAKGKIDLLPHVLLKYRDHDHQVSAVFNAAQKEMNNVVRESYLKQLNFKFDSDQIKYHHLIGNNIIIASKDELLGVERWLLSILKQNAILQLFPMNETQRVLSKLWLDTCGNTNLGLAAFNYYLKSDLNKYYKASLLEKVKLLVKCIVR